VGISPFLSELKGGLFERMEEKERQSTYTHRGGAREDFGAPLPASRNKVAMTSLAKGAQVSHAFFGNGMVVATHSGRSVDVIFERHGLKTLHLDYAKLTIVGG
jgi:DNA helicase-2/ATP-dependent DNA helicase PcrA